MTKYDTFIGVDPGKNGAIAIIDLDGNPFIECTKDPLGLVPGNIIDYLDLPVALIEKVHAMPGQGVTSMFSFGRNYGQLEMWLQWGQSDWDYVTPQTWQKHFNLFKKPGETKTDKKNRHKALAQELFPEIKVTHTNADALLIAHYCREVHG